MGKGDKKTKRGKIRIGSTGITRPRKKMRTRVTSARAESGPAKELETEVAQPESAPKKAAKKTAEPATVAEEKPKAPKAKKKAEADTPAQPEEPKEE